MEAQEFSIYSTEGQALEMSRKHTSSALILKDGTQLATAEWTSDLLTEDAPIILFHHGLGEHHGRQQRSMQAFFDMPIRICGYDARGHGLSDGPRGDAENVDHLVDDFVQVLEHTRAAYPLAPIFIFGHSMGGAVIARYITTHDVPDYVKGVILSAPAIKTPDDLLLRIMKKLGRFLLNVNPKIRLSSGLNARYISTIPREVERYKNDGLNHGSISVRLGMSLACMTPEFYKLAPRVTLPILAYHSHDDRICDIVGTQTFIERVSSKDKTFFPFKHAYHEIHHENLETLNILHELLSKWVKERI